ncbi:MAG: phosphotransferase, partial [Chloroflexota bacterium]|nr:phosphotransferase [Chloroflexota bacterium]
NILWKDGRIVAVIDWEDAALGDPLADVANTRLEILWAFGIDAMQRFTQHYQSITTIDFTSLPVWDLFAALRPASKLSEWAADEIAEQRMRAGHTLFVTHAFEKLAVQ